MTAEFPNRITITAERNLGVAGGRNAGFAAATGDVVVFLDDDALVAEPFSDWRSRVLAPFREDSLLGAIAFRSFIGSGRGHRDPAEFPHTDKSLPHDVSFETFRFIGVGHALRSDAVRDIGPYREEFFYGMEEFDRSFRLMKAGWTIRYDPSFTVNHMKNPAGRVPPKGLPRRMMANKLRVAWMHLPAPLAAACAAAWSVKTAIDARNPLEAARAFGEAAGWAAANPGLRKPIPPHVVGRIRKLGGTPWK